MVVQTIPRAIFGLSIIFALVGCASGVPDVGDVDAKSADKLAQAISGKRFHERDWESTNEYRFRSIGALMLPVEERCQREGGHISYGPLKEYIFSGGGFSRKRQIREYVDCEKPSGENWRVTLNPTDLSARNSTMIGGYGLILSGTLGLAFKNQAMVISEEKTKKENEIRRREAYLAEQKLQAARQVEYERCMKERAERVTSFRANLKLGDLVVVQKSLTVVTGVFITAPTHGMIIGFNKPLIQVQYSNFDPKTEWVKIDQIDADLPACSL